MRSPTPSRSRYRHGTRQRGGALLEFALLLSVLLLIVAGVVEIGRAFWYHDALTKATRDSARYLSTAYAADLGAEASASSSTAKTIVVEAATRAGVPGFTAAAVTVTCTPTACGSAAAGGVAHVTVDATYAMTLGAWVPFIGSGSATSYAVTLAPHTTMPYLR